MCVFFYPTFDSFISIVLFFDDKKKKNASEILYHAIGMNYSLSWRQR